MPIILLGLGAATLGYLGWRWASAPPKHAPRAQQPAAATPSGAPSGVPSGAPVVDPRILAVRARVPYTNLRQQTSSTLSQARATSRYAITPEAAPPPPPITSNPTPLGGIPEGVAQAMAFAEQMGIDPSVAGPLIAQAQAAGIDPLAAIQNVANGVDPAQLAQSFASQVPSIPDISTSFGF